MTQKTPLKTYPCHSETGCLDYTKPCDICNVPKDIDVEIKQLKTQIETAKQILKKRKVGYYGVQYQVQDLRKLFGEIET